ncbi:MAG TPA: carbon storage regulator CsrA [Fervidobacterium sp.]|nr:carbon storage regulator [Fervidobacterium sp.]HOK87697.1 carbon storage regulator CsrA [Fervidobacterium sp.]HOM74002.1 carbon storage regulator CsrA [Fervidobacterium sp.]HOQ39350.1 carbon storage regulator CsrA [Fervidobacterium sp.]HPP17664.1 carbon storage regulator CsrA [Fervidobacterium sp.]
MLVLSRRIGESIMIGDNIEVKILKVDNGVVKIGIVAPSAVKIYRNEVYKTIAEQNIGAVIQDTSEVASLKEVFNNVNKNR